MYTSRIDSSSLAFSLSSHRHSYIYSNPSIGSHGHSGDTRPGQTLKTRKDLSTHESEEGGRGESVGLCAVYMRERGGLRRGGYGLRSVISTVIHT